MSERSATKKTWLGKYSPIARSLSLSRARACILQPVCTLCVSIHAWSRYKLYRLNKFGHTKLGIFFSLSVSALLSKENRCTHFSNSLGLYCMSTRSTAVMPHFLYPHLCRKLLKRVISVHPSELRLHLTSPHPIPNTHATSAVSLHTMQTGCKTWCRMDVTREDDNN